MTWGIQTIALDEIIWLSDKLFGDFTHRRILIAPQKIHNLKDFKSTTCFTLQTRAVSRKELVPKKLIFKKTTRPRLASFYDATIFRRPPKKYAS